MIRTETVVMNARLKSSLVITAGTLGLTVLGGTLVAPVAAARPKPPPSAPSGHTITPQQCRADGGKVVTTQVGGSNRRAPVESSICVGGKDAQKRVNG